MRTVHGIVMATCALGVLGACGKKDEGSPAGTGTGTASAPAAGGGTGTAAPTPTPTAPPPATGAIKGSLTCDEVLPAAMRAEYFKDMEVKEEKPAGASPGVNCTAVSPQAEVAIVTVLCPAWTEDTFKATMEASKKALDGVADVPGVGRMAYRGKMANMEMLQFWDDDTSCYATANVRGDVTAFGKALAAALTPAALDS